MIERGGNGRALGAVDRQRLRWLIDAARRQQIDWETDCRCRGCGVELIDEWTGEERYVAGCRTCSDRCGKRRTRPSMSDRSGASSSAMSKQKRPNLTALYEAATSARSTEPRAVERRKPRHRP